MRLALLAPLALAACVMTDPKGVVVAYNGQTVTMRGPVDLSPAAFGKPAVPSPELVAQARDICPNARLVSTTPTPGDSPTMDYLFLC